MVKRVYVEKRPGFDVEAKQLIGELNEVVEGTPVENVRVINVYDVEGIDDDLFQRAVQGVFSEPQSDVVSFDLKTALAEDDIDDKVFAIEALPGQFDARANSASECIQLISQGERPDVRSLTLYVLEGEVSKYDIEQIKAYLVNPVESRITSLEEPKTLKAEFPVPANVAVVEGFRDFNEETLTSFIESNGLAMDLADIEVLQEYFQQVGRDPYITEIKVVDTYWSDHCRHTTFGTVLKNIEINDERTQEAMDLYMHMRDELGRQEKPVCLMDMGTIAARWLKAKGILTDVDESDEINACTVKVDVDVDGEPQKWLYLFKNETHNHPTEIEPYGGAATCLGGAIRDPLSGRSYVYQAMRVSGCGSESDWFHDRLDAKLPQKKIARTAAAGYSSYGNQIGLATGAVDEIYHHGYVAKHMEVGAVVGAVPAEDVVRECPAPGDVIVLLGGRTGRDGIGGATGSSKAHDKKSNESCGAEVQKGNPPEERKIQRLFRNPAATRMIKRCNDFGAGGVSVAIGELADGIDVDLDAVPLKYMGLDGTEIAISESQERMAVAIAADNLEAFCALAEAENLESTAVAVVTEEPRVKMRWRGETIVDISREFLNKNGAPKFADAKVKKPKGKLGHDSIYRGWRGDKNATNGFNDINFGDFESLGEATAQVVGNINAVSKKGLVERFDSTIGAGTVLMPFGGKNQFSPAQAMVAKLPVMGGKTTTVSGMAWGFDPYLSEADCYLGAYSAVVQSVAKLVATGFKREKMWLSFQEYFEKLRDKPSRWGKPVASLLGALKAQIDLSVGAIGGKDSMSGSYEDIDVPPTLISFATAITDIDRVISPEFKNADDGVYMLLVDIDDSKSITDAMDFVEGLVSDKLISAASTPGMGGFDQLLFENCTGNELGINFENDFDFKNLFGLAYGSFLIEAAPGVELEEVNAPSTFTIVKVGKVIDEYIWKYGNKAINLAELFSQWAWTADEYYPFLAVPGEETVEGEEELNERREAGFMINDVSAIRKTYSGLSIARPRVVIPVFPGTNCEYDTQAAFERAGADCDVFVFNNLNPDKIKESTEQLAKLVNNAQIVMLPGGFSGGDEPDGSAKFITAVFRAPVLTEAVRELLQNRDGLMLGICNGFQALIKLGLVPYGDIVDPTPESPTLTFNTLGRHQSRIVTTAVMSNLSPWLANVEPGETYDVAISHGEGRFVADADVIAELESKCQIATEYVSYAGNANGSLLVNPNGSMRAIEGITSPDGRVFGKMGHSERIGNGLYKNVPGVYDMQIFEAGVSYFR